MRRLKQKIVLWVMMAAVVLCTGCGGIQKDELNGMLRLVLEELASAPETAEQIEESPSETAEPDALLDRDGVYTSCEDVALYLVTYGELPGNFITKKEAQALGWDGGALEPYAPGKCIGGDRFGNYEGNLPKEKGRVYRECDIDTLGAKSRGAKRIVYSNDGLIYYTEDHYESFTLLYE